MANSRKDSKGRKLKDGESQRNDGRYSYRYTDIRTGKRNSIYASNLPELREKEKQLEKDIADHILTDSVSKNMTLDALFDRYIEICDIAESTRANYIMLWNNRIRDEIGNIKVINLVPSTIKAFYSKMAKADYAHSTIKTMHNLIYPTLEMAVADDIIRKNPAKGTLGDYGRKERERAALRLDQQNAFMEFVKNHSIYSQYYPMLVIMLGTGVRCGELIGLTWQDIDTRRQQISIDHQLTYRNYGEGYQFHLTSPKTDSGIRNIPMTTEVRKAFEEQKRRNFLLGIDRDMEVDGMKGFIFTAKSGRPLMPSAVNNVLYNIVDAYNRKEKAKAKKEHRKAELFPKISAHILRHTACTRMAERGMDIKVLQYIMGHAKVEITMQVYNHISDRARIENEMEKMEYMVTNF